MEDMKNKFAVMETSYGTVTLEFYPEDAPNHVRNFIELAEKQFYDGLVFHRIVKGFVIQGGCPRGDGTGGPGHHVDAEFNAHKHMPGTLAMARAQDPNSAGSQFYLCLAPLPQLDGNYTVFGQVTDGLSVVERIGKVETGTGDRPVEPIFIEKIIIKDKPDTEE